MLHFSNLPNMLDYFKHTLDGLWFYYFHSWKVQNIEKHRVTKTYFNIDGFVISIKQEFFTIID